MTAHPAPEELLTWAMAALDINPAADRPRVSVVAGDASNRRYYRAAHGSQSYILVTAPPTTENNAAFLQVRDLLAAAGVRVPALYAADLERGYLLLEDLGNRLLLAELDAASADRHYRTAFAILQQLAGAACAPQSLPAYDSAQLQEELGRFPTWFVEALLGYSPTAAERAMLERLSAFLVESALAQPRVLVHRDFHSRNLMLQGDGQLAVIDFQDAVLGPITYDLVSLLRDCYIQWPDERVQQWALDYRDALVAAGRLPAADAAQFLRWFDWMGLQRHLKVLGTFARLHLRDGKPGYLHDLPLVSAYVLEIVGKYADREPAFAAFDDWYRARLSPLIAGQHWSGDR